MKNILINIDIILSNILFYMKKQSLTEAEMTVLLDKETNFFLKLREGKTELTDTDIIRIAMLLNVSLNDLIKYKSKPNYSQGLKNELNQIYGYLRGLRGFNVEKYINEEFPEFTKFIESINTPDK